MTDCGHGALGQTHVTEAWAIIAVAGPKPRKGVLQTLDGDSSAVMTGLKHMEFSEATFRASPLYVLRATLSGELGLEIHYRPDAAVPVREALINCGLQLFGLEALDILRIEKGYLTHFELNGQPTPYGLGMQGLMKREDNYIERALLERPAFHEPSL